MQFLLSAIGLLVNMNLVFCVFYAMSCGLVVWLVVYAINISGCFVLFGTVISILMKRKEEEGDVRYHSYITQGLNKRGAGGQLPPPIFCQNRRGRRAAAALRICFS